MAHTDSHGTHGPHGAPTAGHETTDANVGGAERFLVAVGVFLAIAFALVWLMYRGLHGWMIARDVPTSPAVTREGDRLPPLPRLQTVPVQDLNAFLAAEADALEAWAWVDKDKGIAQIPVSRAIEIVAAQGLPDLAVEGAASPASPPAAAVPPAAGTEPPAAAAATRPH